MEFQKRSLLFDASAVAHTVAQLKGRRLRMARVLTGFSRQELYEKIGIATSTIDTWESGRVELTEKSAARVCDAFKKVGIYCTVEWLMTGSGNPPRMMTETEKSLFAIEGLNLTRDEPPIRNFSSGLPSFPDENVRRELSFFLGVHKGAMFHVVEKDFMNFRYKKGDCVAGETEDLKNLNGRVIIAQLTEEKTVLCKLLRNSDNESEVFLGKGIPNAKIRILKGAEIIWHRMIKRI
ncbi:MAG: helix-turn-helix domain-containing protein [Holosporaceae bacterium]|nr:helix-turn-helix domain-containing protein [Holosporaceae bacterium]